MYNHAFSGDTRSGAALFEVNVEVGVVQLPAPGLRVANFEERVPQKQVEGVGEHADNAALDTLPGEDRARDVGSGTTSQVCRTACPVVVTHQPRKDGLHVPRIFGVLCVDLVDAVAVHEITGRDDRVITADALDNTRHGFAVDVSVVCDNEHDRRQDRPNERPICGNSCDRKSRGEGKKTHIWG